MVSSSTSSIPKISFKYDVFLSFRGEDTRTNFVDHFYHALMLENIETYKDDKNLARGKKINKELIQAIEDSRFHVIAFSKNYASSSWCLDELVKIIECQEMPAEHTVYPIFYDVEPTQVRKQSGEFGKAFSKHKNDEDAEKWKKAMVEATSFGGRDLSTTADGHEVNFIKLVVKDISLKLPVASADANLVGMRTRVNGVISSLNAVPDEFCMIGIWGMGGGGKTTLARAVFDQICNDFEGSSFVENVRESSTSLLLGLKSLQQQVLRDVLKRQDIIVNGVLDGKKMMKKKLPSRKVLVVLDDVDHIDQLKALAGEPNWFMPGSKVIVTTRDKQVLVAHKVLNSNIHDVNLLTDEEAICLLSRHAFGTERPTSGYEKLSRKVVSYASGLPLTITILGLFLCDANKHIWIDTLERLKKIPLDETLQKLELSYMGLDTDCKEIFLDIACILKGLSEDEAIKALESRGFHAIHGLSVLKNRSLITVSKYGYLGMHDHIQEMGRYIVRRSNLNEARRHTRLWIGEEIIDILVNDLDTEATCINLFTLEINPETIMKGLGKMEKLRLLLVSRNGSNLDWEFDEASQYFPSSLQYLAWSTYPFCSLPKTFQASNLVTLEMLNSRIVQLWKEGERKVLHKLRFLDLSYSSFLKTLDLRLAPNIETLNLIDCKNLVELDMPPECLQLKSFNLCSPKLRSLNLGLAPNIESLNLKNCDGLVKLDMPHECPQLKSLYLSCVNLRSFNLGLTSNIETLKLEECDYLVELDMSLKCPQLKSLDLEISKVRTLDLGPTPNLEILRVQGCLNLVELHMHDECCKVKTLNLGCLELRTFDHGPFLNLEALTFCGHHDLLQLLISVGCPQLKYLRLVNSKLRTVELTPNVKTLILEYCDLVELHIPAGDVKLESLDIHRCSKLKTLDLRRTPSLESLCLEECSGLVKVHAPIGVLKKFIKLGARGLSMRFTRFMIVDTHGLLPELDLTAKSVGRCSLHRDNYFRKFQFECSYMEGTPSPNGNIEKLISEGFSCACTDLQSFFGSICGLQHLTKLSLKGSIPEVPKDLDRLQCLEKLTLKSTKIKHLPDSICMCKHLKYLELFECQLLEKLPEDLGQLECLESLKLEWCMALQDIPKSICRMKSLKYFRLHWCTSVKELPEELVCLEGLKKLDILGTCISNLPQNI